MKQINMPVSLKDGDYSLLSSIVEIKAGVNPSYEVGKLQVKIKTSIIEKLSVDSAYFLSFRIKEATPYEINEEKGMYYSEFIKRISMHPKRHPLTMPLPALWMMS